MPKTLHTSHAPQIREACKHVNIEQLEQRQHFAAGIIEKPEDSIVPESVANAVIKTSAVAGGVISARVNDADYKDLAYNLGSINYWSPFWPFADALKMESRGWMTGSTASTLPLLKDTNKTWVLDAQGYVKTVGRYNAKPYQNSFASSPPNTTGNRRAPVGRYVVTWKGDGDINMNGAVSSLISNTTLPDGTRRKEYNLTSGYPGIVVDNFADGTTGGDYVRDVHIWMPDYTDPQNKSLEPAAGAPLPLWNPHYIALLQEVAPKLGYLRFMDWIDTNSSPVTKWEDNRPADYAFASGNTSYKLLNVPGISDTSNYGGIGVPWEYIIDLCNTINVNPWINVPHGVDFNSSNAETTTDATYITNLAKLFAGEMPDGNGGFKTGLKAGLKVYVEYSNEVWNSGTEFAQGDWANSQAAKYKSTHGISTVFGKPEYSATRTADVHYVFDQVFQDVFGTNRSKDVIRVAAAFSGQVYYNEHYIERYNIQGKARNGGVDFFADVMAATTYFGNASLIKYIFNETGWSNLDASQYLSSNFDVSNDSNKAFFKKVFDWWTQQVIATSSYNTSGNWTTARKYNLSYVAYEGGPALYTESVPVYIKDGKIVDSTTTGASKTFSLSSYVKQNYTDDTPNDKSDVDRFTKMIMALNMHPRMAEVYQALLQNYKSRGMKTHGAFNDVNEWTKFGQWGTKAYQDQVSGYGYGQAVKWQFLKDWATDELPIRNVDNPLGNRPELPANGALTPVNAGKTYSKTITAISHGDGSGNAIKWEIVAGYLPPGLTFTQTDEDHATITGTPTTTGTYRFIVRVLDADKDVGYGAYSIDVGGTSTGGTDPDPGGGGGDPDPGGGGGTPTDNNTYKFTPTDDTYATQNTSSASTEAEFNQGDKTFIYAGTGFRTGYLKYDVRNKIVPGVTIDSIYLRVYINRIEGTKPGTLRLLWLESVGDKLKDGTTDWSEENMQYQYAPNSQIASPIGSTLSLPTAPTGWVQFDVTDYVKNNLDSTLGGTGDGIFSFAVRGRVVGGDNNFVGVQLASKDYGTGERAPQLIVNQSEVTTPVRGDISSIVPAERNTAVPSATVTFTTPVSGFDVSDLVLTRNGVVMSLSGVSLSTTDNKTFTINGLGAADGLSGLTYASGLYVLTLKTNGTGIAEAGNTSNTLISGDAETWTTQLPATVVNRYVFYNNSYYDGNDANANTLDDNAIATNKTALLPGQTASVSNITNYVKGINGVIVDIRNLKFSELTADDLEFKVGNSTNPSSWTTLTTMPDISIRHGVGSNDIDRITMVWPDGTITKKWLQVRIKANVTADNSATGLTADDVFYFGNMIGDSGNAPTSGTPNYVETNATDVAAIRLKQTGFTRANVTNMFDIDRDSYVNTIDINLARDNQSGFSVLPLFTA